MLYFIKELLIMFLVIPFVVQLVYLAGTIIIIKGFSGKVEGVIIGGGKKILKLKGFQLNMLILKRVQWDMSGIDIDNRVARIIIHLSGGLINILLGVFLVC